MFAWNHAKHSAISKFLSKNGMFQPPHTLFKGRGIPLALGFYIPKFI